jgi:hypothetical protein
MDMIPGLPEEKNSLNFSGGIPNLADFKKEVFIRKCAVFIKPDESQLAMMLSKYGRKMFFIIAEENNYYNHVADAVLRNTGTNCIYLERKKLEFIKFDGNSVTLEPEELEGWELLLFDPRKEPKKVKSMDIARELSYFK